MFDLGTHYLDQVLHLFGEPDSYNSLAKTLRPNSKITDYFSIELSYEDKVVRIKSCMHASHASHPDVRYKLHTDRGTYYFYEMDAQEIQLLDGVRPLDSDYGDKSTYDFFDLDGDKSSHQLVRGDYLMYFDMLADAIRNDGPLPVSNEDAVRVITYLEDINQ